MDNKEKYVYSSYGTVEYCEYRMCVIPDVKKVIPFGVSYSMASYPLSFYMDEDIKPYKGQYVIVIYKRDEDFNRSFEIYDAENYEKTKSK